MPESEKITINLNVVDVGKIDLLVERGFYSNRTDFIKAAIRDLLEKHSEDVRRGVDWNVWCLGITDLSRKDLEKALRAGEKKSVFVVGLLIVHNDVTPDLVRQTVKSCKVFGVTRASSEVKAALEELED